MRQWPALRDAMLFVAGLAIAAHETLVARQERPVIIGLAVSMLGLPSVFRKTL